jgi:hypothetical protein
MLNVGLDRIPRSDVAHCDAAVLNRSDRILSHGAPPKAGHAECTSRKSRKRLAPVLTQASSWTSEGSPRDAVAMHIDKECAAA